MPAGGGAGAGGLLRGRHDLFTGWPLGGDWRRNFGLFAGWGRGRGAGEQLN